MFTFSRSVSFSWSCLFSVSTLDSACLTCFTSSSKPEMRAADKRWNADEYCWVWNEHTHPKQEDMHLPCRSEIVSEPWVCSRFSVSSAACRLMFSLSSESLLFSSMQHLSCSSLTWASSCCSCFELSVWVLRSRAAASDSARSNAFASSSCRREKESL